MENCFHCGLPIPADIRIERDAKRFCCLGCATVYELLTAAHLGRYYTIKADGVSWGMSRPAQSKQHDFSMLDDSELANQYLTPTPPRQIRFFLEGIHCMACVWVLEQLSQMNTDIVWSRFNLGQSVVTVAVRSGASLAQVARLLAALGYSPQPLAVGEDATPFQTRFLRKLTIRIGVAGAITGNIMLLAICRYAGLGGAMAQWFDWIMAILALPIFLYVAIPFYISAWGAVRRGRVNIDVPVSLAIGVGYGVSVFNLMRGSHSIYFDSVSMFAFLLMITRTFFISTSAHFEDTRMMSQKLLPRTAQLLTSSGDLEWVLATRLAIGDIVVIEEGALIPADGELVSPTAWIDAQLLTGESMSESVKQGTIVFAGTRNSGESIRIKVVALAAHSRISGLIRQLDELEKPVVVQWADRIATRLVGIILLGATAVFFVTWYGVGLDRAIDQYLAFVLISCPCALAIATPLTYAFAQQQALAHGILSLKPDLFDRLKSVNTLFFDKTGTLTTGQLSVTQITVLRGDFQEILPILGALEARSTHPVAGAIRRYLAQHGVTEPFALVEDWHQVYGRGISGIVNGCRFEMVPLSPDRIAGIQYRLSLQDAHGEMAIIAMEDQLSAETRREVSRLSRDYPCTILSGDHPDAVAQVARELGIASFKSRLTPEQKQQILSEHPHALMVGDGANDAPALKQASVGIAVRGGFEASIQSSDALILGNSLSGIDYLLRLGRRVGKILPINLAISLAYNIGGIMLVFLGLLTPLIAAVLMPLSAATVMAIGYWGIKQIKVD